MCYNRLLLVKLLKIDHKNAHNQKSAKSSDVGFIADRAIKGKLKEKVVNDRDHLRFKMQCKDSLETLVSKIKVSGQLVW